MTIHRFAFAGVLNPPVLAQRIGCPRQPRFIFLQFTDSNAGKVFFTVGHGVAHRFEKATRDQDRNVMRLETKAGGGFGSIIGRNSFQRSKPDAIALLRKIMDIYAG